MPREQCPQCQRPPELCYCSALVQIGNKIKVTIILHPQEQKHPFNTGRIAHLCLNNSELIIAEKLSDKVLESLLSTPSALLYPSLSWLPEIPEITATDQQQDQIQQLIVIDATWRKSKKILHLNPALQQLPRVNLSGGSSNYQIRKTSMEEGLSTLESIVAAMQLLEPKTNFKTMLKPFETMIDLQQTAQQANNLPNTMEN